MARKNGNETVRLQAPHWTQDERDASGNLIKEGEYVIIRKYVTHGIQRKVQAAMADFIKIEQIDVASAAKNPNATPDMKMQIDVQRLMKQGNDTQLLAMLVDWNFLDEHGHKLPLTQEGLDDVADEDIEYIMAQIDSYNAAPVSQEDRDAFLQTLSNGSEANTTPNTLHLGG